MEVGVIGSNGAWVVIAFCSDLRVAQVREVHGLRAFTNRALLEFNEIADTRPGFQMIVRPQSGERANDDAVVEAALRYDAMRLDGHVVTEDGIRQDAPRSNDAARANFSFAQQLHARIH